LLHPKGARTMCREARRPGDLQMTSKNLDTSPGLAPFEEVHPQST
jgi:hypothetical protein